jgi:AI-2 transport system permease protein
VSGIRSRTIDRLAARAGRGSTLDGGWIVALVIILAAELLYFSLTVSGFFEGGTGLLSLTEQFLDVGALALGLSFVILAGEIDLSAGAIASFAGIVMAVLWKDGLEIWLAVAAAVAITTLIGAVNGVIVTLFKVNSLLVTLATQFIITSAATAIGGDSPPFGFPQSLLSYVGTGAIGPIPAQLIIFAVLATVVAVVVNRTRFGRALALIGYNREAARYTGISVSRTVVGAFALSGLFAGVAGIMISAFYNAARDDIGLSLLLPAITVVVLGGVDIFGGSGRIAGVIVATFVLGFVTEGLLVGGHGSLTATMVTGIVLLLCLVLKLAIDRGEGEPLGARLRRRFPRHPQPAARI